MLAPRALGRLAAGLACATALVGVLLSARPGHAEDPPAPEPPAAPATPPLVLLASGESLGNLEPCNCVEGMLGGFPRRLALLKRERARAEAALVLDGGDLSGKALHPGLIEAKTRAALDLLVQAGATALVVGERDLRLGVDALLQLADEAGLLLLGANLRRLDGSRPFAPSLRLPLRGRELLIVGLLDPELGDPSGELEMEPPADALREALVGAGEATVVVWFHGRGESARAALAGALAGVDLLICGHDQQSFLPLGQLEGTPWVETLRDARAISRIELGEAARLEHLRLDGHIPDDPAARQRVEQYYEDVRHLPEPPREPREGGDFMGAQVCGTCHTEALEVFQATRHHGAQARITAADPERAGLFECTVCHVTGMGFEGGFRSLDETPHLGEVSCEACHGVGGNHVMRGGGRGYGVRSNFPESWRPVCVGCHDPTNSPKFEFEAWLERIKHWEAR